MKFVTTLKQKAKKLKSEAQVLMLAFRDKRTPFKAKLLVGFTVGYLLSPIDLIPDVIPVLGLLDDVILVPLLITLSIRAIPTDILNEIKEDVKRNPQQLKKNNWLFASIFILAWLAVAYLAFGWIRHFFVKR